MKKILNWFKQRNLIAKIGIIFAMLIAVAMIGFLIYTSIYYEADEVVVEAMSQNSTVYVEGDYTVFPSSTSSEIGFIFYPGAKVEHLAYYPLMENLSQNGITCVLVEMPFNLAVFNVNAADEVYDMLPEIEEWYIGGHSLGGAMASDYASNNEDKVEGLILLGAYVYGDYPKEQSLTIYGSNDEVLDKSEVDYTENVVVIEGGNHAQFGNYGEQKGDGTATITADQQQDLTVEAIVEFVGE